jgi:predicted transcriptional regulator
MGVTKTNLFTGEQNTLAEQAKAFSHPARVAIIQHLLKVQTCINSDLVEELGLAQPTISQHLKELKAIGIIHGNIEGAKICYCINPTVWKELQNKFDHLFKAFKPEGSDCC